ncbi:MAG TPA: PAS domain-containing protein [Thermoanaerobaculia bacterium]|nr:PAS domain-containing protein [Thermoanaerobaculia bacterium]
MDGLSKESRQGRAILRRYGAATAAVVVALVVKLLLDHTVETGAPFLLFPLAILVAAWFGGLGPGLFATALATVMAASFLVPDAQVSPAVVARGVVFVLQGIGISLIALALQRAKEKAEQDARRAQATAEELRRRDDQILLITNSLPVLISYIDSSHRYRFVNQAYEDWFGLPRKEILGRHAREILGDSAYDSLRPFFDEALTGQLVTYEREVHYLRAGTREVNATYVPHVGEGGRVEGFIVLVADVSERKRVERELAEANRRAAIILESISEIFFSVDRDWRLTLVNQHYRENPLPGAERVRVGEVLWDLFPELVGTPVEERYRHAMDTGEPVRFEASGVLSGRWYEIRVYPSAEGLSVFATDLTERKQAEEAVRSAKEAAERQSSQLQGLARAAVAVNAALSVEEALEVITDQAREIVGAHQSVIRMTVDGDLDDPSADRHPGEIAVPLVGRDGKNIGVLQLSGRTDGELTPSDEAILVQLAQMAAVAIENQQLYRAAQAARAEAETANRMKDQFLATLSHELRTPLNAIFGWAQLLRAGKLDPATVERGVETIERNARAQKQLIDDLLDVSRIISGKLRLEMQPVEPAGVVEAALETIAPAAQAKGVSLRRRVSRTGLVVGDPQRLQQVVWNLLSNAVKFTPKGGEVRVSVEALDGHTEITVADTGQGIALEFLPHVFERFRQADPSSTRRHGGLGLGLAIVRQLVELHGGTVRAESPGEGRGATFVVSLPLAVSSEPEERRRTQAADGGSRSVSLEGVRVLVVDDEADARDLLGQILSRSNAEVAVAASAAEGLEVLERFQPHVIVSDISMPGQDGYDFIRTLRKRGHHLPAAALTAFARAEDRRRALLAGFQIHLAKPIDPGELTAAVASLAGRAGETDSE